MLPDKITKTLDDAGVQADKNNEWRLSVVSNNTVLCF